MPVTQQFIDLNAEFASIPPGQAIIINDLSNRTEADQLRFNYLIREVYTSDMISMLPSCSCGERKGEHRIGSICDECGTPVKQSIEDDIKSLMWFRKPIGITKLILPIFLIILEERFKKRNFSVIHWLLDRSYTPGGGKPAIMQKLISDNIPRGYNNFIENFDAIIVYLLSLPEYKQQRHLEKHIRAMLRPENPITGDILLALIEENRHLLFVDYLPIPNKALLVIEQSFAKNYVESHALGIHNALNTMRSIDRDHYDKKPTSIENRTARIMFMLSDYTQDYVGTNLRPKPGIFRKHVYGTRANHTFRAVITSHDSIHEHDEIHIPWCVAVTVFEQHLLGILMRPGHAHGNMSHTEATQFLMNHIKKYHPLLDTLFKEMIAGSRHGAIYSLVQRNPSLLRGSSQCVRITKVKPDVEDQTVSLSDLIATAMNAKCLATQLEIAQVNLLELLKTRKAVSPLRSKRKSHGLKTRQMNNSVR